MIGGLPLHPRSRIAPTPSGFLHPGNGAAFLLTHRLVSERKGTLLLRIDDLDAERVRPEYLEDIFDSLRWLGIDWDEGPGTPDELARNWSQQLRIARYLELAARLRDLGVLYACDCSRRKIRELVGDGPYPGTCRDRGLSLDTPEMAWRLQLPEVCRVSFRSWPNGEHTVDLVSAMGDPVLRQRNGQPAYQLASLADDVDQRMDLIVRGEDLLASTACQVHLARLLGFQAFAEAVFVHHPLLTDAGGRKLSKTDGDGSLKALQEDGVRPERIEHEAERLLKAMLDT